MNFLSQIPYYEEINAFSLIILIFLQYSFQTFRYFQLSFSLGANYITFKIPIVQSFNFEFIFLNFMASLHPTGWLLIQESLNEKYSMKIIANFSEKAYSLELSSYYMNYQSLETLFNYWKWSLNHFIFLSVLIYLTSGFHDFFLWLMIYCRYRSHNHKIWLASCLSNYF
jgi:hypothetical protein